MSRIRLNSEYRNKGGVRFREHLEQENTQEKESYLQARERIIPLQKDTWKLAEQIVRRHYTDEDVKTAYHLQNKFDTVSPIAKDKRKETTQAEWLKGYWEWKNKKCPHN